MSYFISNSFHDVNFKFWIRDVKQTVVVSVVFLFLILVSWLQCLHINIQDSANSFITVNRKSKIHKNFTIFFLKTCGVNWFNQYLKFIGRSFLMSRLIDLLYIIDPLQFCRWCV